MGVIDELAQWIDANTIAQAIVDELEEQGAQATFENGKTIWLDVLENELPDAISSSVKARLDCL
ncbi:unnamed protein product [marine sediment metagenome]|uniref:Uncharacterized protein n=1 Tax=marine sediment metagenome TaxID=412755 RepID=X1KWV1_9ZZZZ